MNSTKRILLRIWNNSKEKGNSIDERNIFLDAFAFCCFILDAPLDFNDYKDLQNRSFQMIMNSI